MQLVILLQQVIQFHKRANNPECVKLKNLEIKRMTQQLIEPTILNPTNINKEGIK